MASTHPVGHRPWAWCHTCGGWIEFRLKEGCSQCEREEGWQRTRTEDKEIRGRKQEDEASITNLMGQPLVSKTLFAIHNCVVANGKS